MKKRRVNPKRRIVGISSAVDCDVLSDMVTYVGSQYHKHHLGDFDLALPAHPRPDASLCDSTGIDLLTAKKLLKAGVLRGLISEQRRGAFPQNIWAVDADGNAFEAQLDNEVLGTYHGYPISTDPFSAIIAKRWQEVRNGA